MRKRTEYSYNERLFSSGLRKKLHTARFYWLANSLTKLNFQCTSVLELGAFDGKAIEYLPAKPVRYLGLDANWEGGLDLARERWQHEPNFTFRECHTPEEVKINGETFDMAICMDTLEHVPPGLVEPYLHELAKAITGYIFISVPNEKGMVFFFKHLAKILSGGDVQRYSAAEFLYATLGRMEKVTRREHKGFDYDVVIRSVANYFDLCSVTGYPFEFLPRSLNFGIGIIGKI
jgi:2-polyprenyl-3-methyl-5-hydroxy-6-metoxy-1,4-benzoquinol methylase